MVPRLLHFIVGPKASPLIQRCLDSWLILQKVGFEIRIWNDDLIEVFIAEKYPFLYACLKHARNHAEVADIARYAIVHYYGGYYMDWDVELLNVRKFLKICDENPFGYLIQDPLNQTLASESFSAQKEEPYLFSLIDNINDIYIHNFRDSMETPQFSGPYRMREVFYFLKQKTQQNIILVKDAFLYDYTEIREMPERDRTTAMIHYWTHSWL